jgi:hypothetical protein
MPYLGNPTSSAPHGIGRTKDTCASSPLHASFHIYQSRSLLPLHISAILSCTNVSKVSLVVYYYCYYYYTLFLPRGKVRLRTSCSKGCQNPTPCWTRQIQARPNQPWARLDGHGWWYILYNLFGLRPTSSILPLDQRNPDVLKAIRNHIDRTVFLFQKKRGVTEVKDCRPNVVNMPYVAISMGLQMHSLDLYPQRISCDFCQNPKCLEQAH